jgi:hypothetical protein
LAECSQLASDVALQLAASFGEQIDRLASASDLDERSPSKLLGVLRTTACVGGRLAFAYLDANGVVSDSTSDTSNEVAADVIASSSSADVLVGSRELGAPTPFAQVVAEFCFLLMLAELETMRNESLGELTARLVRTVMTLTPSEETVGARITSGARSLLDRLTGANCQISS